MPITGDRQILMAWVGNGTPDDPNLVSADELMAYAVPSTVASAATSTVTSQVASGGLGSVPISTADSKAVSSGSQASTADSKTLSGSTNTSVADSKSLSVSKNVSVADSKATSVAAATIVPTLNGIPGFQQADSGAVIRTANSKMADVVNAADFNAKGDGSTDDTAAIQAALTALAARGGGVLSLTAIHLLNATVTVGSNTTIVGGGIGGGGFKARNGSNITGAMLSLVGATNVRLQGLELDANTDNTGAKYAVMGAGGTRNRVERCYIHDTNQAGVSFLDEHDSRVEFCTLLRCGRNAGTDNHGILMGSVSATGLTGCSASHNFVDTAYRKGITIFTAVGGLCSDTKVIGNTITGCGLGGVYVANATGASLQRNTTVQGNVAYGNYTNFLYSGVRGGTFTGNAARSSTGDCDFQFTDLISVAIQGISSDSAYLSAVKFSVVDLASNSYITFVGNVLSRCNRSVGGYAPAVQLNDTKYAIVRQNILVDADNHMTHTVVETGTSDFNLVCDNIADLGSTGLGTVLLGSSSVAQGMSGRQQGINTLTPANTLDIDGGITIRGQLWTTVANGANNNVALPTNARGGKAYKLTITNPPVTTDFSITGIAGGVDGWKVLILNYSAGNMTLKHNSGSSSVGNKIFVGGAADLVISTFGAVELVYDSTASAWTVTGYKA